MRLYGPNKWLHRSYLEYKENRTESFPKFIHKGVFTFFHTILVLSIIVAQVPSSRNKINGTIEELSGSCGEFEDIKIYSKYAHCY